MDNIIISIMFQRAAKDWAAVSAACRVWCRCVWCSLYTLHTCSDRTTAAIWLIVATAWDDDGPNAPQNKDLVRVLSEKAHLSIVVVVDVARTAL